MNPINVHLSTPAANDLLFLAGLRAAAGARRAHASDTASGQFSSFGVLAVLRDACELGNQGTMS